MMISGTIDVWMEPAIPYSYTTDDYPDAPQSYLHCQKDE